MSDEIKLCLSRTDEPSGGAWLTLPASAAQFQEALQTIGADIGRQDFFVSHLETNIPAVDALLIANPDSIVGASLDELNYLTVKMNALDAVQCEKLNAISNSDYRITSLERLIDYDFNTDCFVHIPAVFNPVQLGEHYLNETEMIQMPEEWTGAINVQMLGELAAEHEMGVFTSYGYILPSGDEWQHDFEDDRHIPDEYRITKDAERKPSIREQLTAAKEQAAPKAPEAKPHRSDPDLS